MMGLPGKGGRAQRARYQCKSKRIPIDLEAQIDQLIKHYLDWLDTPNSYVMPNWVLQPKKQEEPTPAPTTKRQEWDEYLEAIDDDEDIDDDWEAAITRITPPSPESLAPVIHLTPSQEDALSKLQVFIAVGTEKYFRLTGYAGTGKSFLICEFMRWLQLNKLTFIAASPTNKASKNLAKLATAAKLTVDVTTVAKLLGQQPILNEMTGIEEFLIEEGKDLNRYDVIVLDEFSMISKANFEQIQNAVPGKTKLIFIGDAAQLPPVNEKEPIVMTLPMEGATLSEIVRYDGAIARVAEEVRSNPQYNRVMYPFTTSDDGTIVCRDRQSWLAEAGKFFNSAEFKSNPDYCRFLVWRNNTADKLNAWVRSLLWGEDCPPYVIGDRLIAKKPVFRETTSFTRRRTKKKEWTIVMANSEECVVSAAPELKTDSQGWEFWSVPVTTDDGNRQNLLLLTLESEKKRTALMTKYKEKKEWWESATIDKLYDHCPHAYAITTHKAQGSSIDNVFVDTGDMRGCPDLQKLLYTALTRTKKMVYIPVY